MESSAVNTEKPDEYVRDIHENNRTEIKPGWPTSRFERAPNFVKSIRKGLNEIIDS